ncbi:MAG: DUF4398 domain-containing protein [Bacteroidota bacterium]
MKHPARSVPSLVLALALVTAGCAGSKLPPPNLSTAQNAIAEADESGASEAAPLALRNARQKLDQAEQAVEREDYGQARYLADQAQVDAELAEARARSATAMAAVDELRESIRVLREEINRSRRTGDR